MVKSKADIIVFSVLGLLVVILALVLESVARDNVRLEEKNKALITANERIEQVNTGLYNEVERLEAVSMEAWQLFFYCTQADTCDEYCVYE